MAKVPEKLLYLKTHEWVRLENEKAYMGITDYAQDQLGDVVFVELPAADTKLKQGDGLATVESVKAASDIYAPVSGTVVEVNEALNDNPQLVNEDPYGQGWMAVLTIDNEEELEGLLSVEAYTKFLEEEA